MTKREFKALEQEPNKSTTETLVSLGAYKQVVWERDIAIEQLHELGYEFGQKIEPTPKNDLGVDAVSRQAVLNTLDNMDSALDEDRTVETYKELLKECYKVLPSVTPQEPILDKITEIIEPLRHLSIDEMSNIEWQILQVIDKYKAESEKA